MSRKYRITCEKCGVFSTYERVDICPRCHLSKIKCTVEFTTDELNFALGHTVISPEIKSVKTPITAQDIPDKNNNCNDSKKNVGIIPSPPKVETDIPKPTISKLLSVPVTNHESSVDIAFSSNQVVGCDNVKQTLTAMIDRKDVYDTTGGKDGISIRTQSIIITGDELSGKSLIKKVIAEILLYHGIRKNKSIQVINLEELIAAHSQSGMKGISQLFEKIKDVIVTFSDNIDKAFIQQDGSIRINQELITSLLMVINKRCTEITFILESSKSVGAAFISNPENKHRLVNVDISPYTKEELIKITEKRARDEYRCSLSPDAETMLHNLLSVENFSEDYSSGNCINETIETAYNRYTKRVKIKKATIGIFEKEDFMWTNADWNEVKKVRDELDNFSEQTEVIESADNLIKSAKINEQRMNNGLPPLQNELYNMLFIGPPGSGKSTIAPLFAKLFKALGILKKGHVLEIDKGDLESPYTGDSASKMRAFIQQALDGVLFIDEAYTLIGDKTKGKNSGHGEEALEILLNSITKYRKRLVVILGGYKNETEKLLNFNPGMPSRFPTTINFIEYSTDTLLSIFYKSINSRRIDIYPGSETEIRLLIEKSKRSPKFVGARGIMTMIDNLNTIANDRVAKNDSIYDGIVHSDVITLLGDYNDDNSLDSLLAQLNRLPGLHNVKKAVNKLVSSSKGDLKLRKKGIQTGDSIPMNLCLLGQPGTCKTTVAKLLAKIYLQLGLLKKDVFVECSARDLIAGYVGMSEERVSEYLSRAEGGCLFIDEFYSLCLNENNTSSYSQGVIEKINAVADENKLMIIIAGYPDKMLYAINHGNDGLDSRFKTKILFDEYTDDELLDIFTYHLEKRNLTLPTTLIPNVKAIIASDKEKTKERGSVYGNGRNMRNLVDSVVINYKSRISELPEEEDIDTAITEDDLKEV